MAESTYDYVFQCDALQSLVPGQNILVTQWHGTEAVSRLYRFDITVAVRGADLDLEKLLDQTATLQLRNPDGSTSCWHGIITQGSQYGHDESYDYYQVVLEPRLARLGLQQWSDIYLSKQLDDIITALLKQARLTEKYSGGDSSYDYHIAVSGQDLSLMSRPFVCQFDETCLDFLMRKLEFYGVYFWFVQGEDREAVVFGNDASQQPEQVDSAIYYPKGALDPDISQVVITQMDKRVTLRPATVSLRSLHDQDNTQLDMYSQASVPGAQAGAGEFQTVADNFSVVSGTGSSTTGVSGDTLAKWRAQTVACQNLLAQGQARTPGVLAGRMLAVSEFQRQADANQYYIVSVEHAGVQTLETSPGSGDEPPYRARFTALPRWRDQSSQSDPVQFRPQCITPVPRVARLMTGFVDSDAQSGAKRYAQPDDQGRYKVRMPFIRTNHGGYNNSAWLRLSTPYSAGASDKNLKRAGMHFPLREGTEVLIAFLNGDPDQPVIVGSLPNTEAPSVVAQANARDHVIRTPGGSGMVIVDGGGGEDGTNTDSSVCASTPTASAVLNLGAASQAVSDAKDGFVLSTDANGAIHAGQSLVVDVPNSYHMEADNTTNGYVNQSFIGQRYEKSLASSMSATFGVNTDVFGGAKIEGLFATGTSVSWTYILDLNLKEKKGLFDSKLYTGKSLWQKIMTFNSATAKSSTETLEYSVAAYTSYNVSSPIIELTAVDSSLNMTAASATLTSPAVKITGTATVDVEGGTSTLISGGADLVQLGDGVKVTSATGISMGSTGTVTISGSLMQWG